MKLCTCWVVVNTLHLGMIIGLLVVSLSKTTTADNAQVCYNQIKDAVSPLLQYSTYFLKDDIEHLIPIIEDNNGEGKVQDFCEKAQDKKKLLVSIKDENCESYELLDMVLVKYGGYNYMCDEGQVDYGKHYKCIDQNTEKVHTECKMKDYTSLNDIHRESLDSSTASSLCTMMSKYLQCAEDVISKECNDKSTGKWYHKFIQGVFNKLITKSSNLDCDFGDPLIPMWAVAIIVIVALLILWCIGRWLYNDGYCHRCCQCIFRKQCSSRRDSEKSGDDEKIESLTYRRGSLVDTLGDVHVPMTALHLDDGDSASLTGQPPQEYTRTPMKNGLMH